MNREEFRELGRKRRLGLRSGEHLSASWNTDELIFTVYGKNCRLRSVRSMSLTPFTTEPGKLVDSMREEAEAEATAPPPKFDVVGGRASTGRQDRLAEILHVAGIGGES